MNVFLRKTLLLAFFGLLVVPLWAQQDVFLSTFPEESVDFFYTSHNGFTIGTGVDAEPLHGQLVGPIHLNSDKFQFKYTPDPGFVGRDSFVYYRLGCASPSACFETWTVFVDVRPTEVNANQDIVFTAVNTGLSIDVTANDTNSKGELSLTNIPMVNNGTATIQGGQVLFTPDTDFVGVASFNYTVCDEYGICGRTTVNVIVNDEGSMGGDTLNIFTNKNKPVLVLVAPNFENTLEPANGAFVREGGVPLYIPDTDFVGTDVMRFETGVNKMVAHVTVLDVQKNMFAADDEAAVTPGESVEIDVLANDAFGGNTCFNGLVTQAKYGTVVTDANAPGLLTYIAPEGFTGVDEFTYSAKDNNCGAEEETATVSVYVSNYEPAYSKFYMSTPRRTPLVIGYNVPITDFRFELEEQAREGRVVFLEGQRDTAIYGQRITGYNLILYIPDEDMDQGTDEFELSYCVTNSDSGCRYSKGVKVEVDILNIGNAEEPMCFDDCIWAGDTNFDGIVNVEDILPVGLYMGQSGDARSEVDLQQWYGQYGDDWNDEQRAQVDIKHVDTDGDSLVTALDTMAIRKFYGRTHSMTAAKIPYYNFTVKLQGDIIAQPGDMVELDMIIGDEANPAIDLYGFTFNLPYNPSFFDAESVQLVFNDNSWMTYNSPVLSMVHTERKGVIESGFTRTNAIAISGFGKVAKARFIISDDISGIKPGKDGTIDVQIGGGKYATATTGSGQSYGIFVEPITIKIKVDGEDENTTPEDKPELAPVDSDLKVFPNPAQNRLNLHLNSGFELNRLQIFTLTGQLALDSGTLSGNTAGINISSLQSGVYFVRATTNQGAITKKIEVIE